MGGSPSLVGSPGRSELARGIRYSSRSGSVDDIKVSSPQLQAQVRHLIVGSPTDELKLARRNLTLTALLLMGNLSLPDSAATYCCAVDL